MRLAEYELEVGYHLEMLEPTDFTLHSASYPPQSHTSRFLQSLSHKNVNMKSHGEGSGRKGVNKNTLCRNCNRVKKPMAGTASSSKNPRGPRYTAAKAKDMLEKLQLERMCEDLDNLTVNPKGKKVVIFEEKAAEQTSSKDKEEDADNNMADADDEDSDDDSDVEIIC